MPDHESFADEQSYIAYKQHLARLERERRRIELAQRSALSPRERAERDRLDQWAKAILRRAKRRENNRRWRAEHPRSAPAWAEWLYSHDHIAYHDLFITMNLSLDAALSSWLMDEESKLRERFNQLETQIDMAMERRSRHRIAAMAHALREALREPTCETTASQNKA